MVKWLNDYQLPYYLCELRGERKMKKCNLPTRKQCFNIIKQYHVPLHIVKHNSTVAKLAVFLAQRLKEKAIAVDIELVDRACLLHDIARPCDFRESDYDRLKQTITEQDKAMCLERSRKKWQKLIAEYQGLCHEEIAYELLRKKYPELALTIKKHRYTAILEEKEKPATWEEKIVYYADKRVMHDRIVPLKERLEEAHKRNIHLHAGQAQSDIDTNKIDSLIFKLEKEISGKIDLNPLEVTDEFIDSYLSDASQD
jgi:putative nucleotidyltransferase with HDIG domain